MGKAALEGRPGIIDVKNGWSGRREINVVTFDKEKITVEEMEQILIQEKTYRGTAGEP